MLRLDKSKWAGELVVVGGGLMERKVNGQRKSEI